MPKYSIIIPVFNEERYLITNISQIYSHAQKLLKNFEIVLSENGSTDRTLKIARKLSRKFSRLRIISSPAADYGLAVKNAFLAARGQYLILFDLDYWNFDFVIQAVPLFDKYSAVVGSKNLFASHDQRSFLRKLSSRIFTLLLKILFGLKISDTHGLKILNRAVILPLVKQCVTTKETLDTELLIRCQYAGLALGEIPVSVIEHRPSRTSIIKRSFRAVRDLLRLKFLLVPYLLALTFSLLVTFLVLLPSLQIPFSFIDDGYFLEHSVLAKNSILLGNFSFIPRVFLEAGTGRVRPFYWLSLFIRFLIFGKSSFLFHLFNVVIALAITYLAFKIFYRFLKSGWWSAFGVLAMQIFWRTSENYFRLGPQEPLALLFILASFFLVPSYWAIPLGLLAVLTKETSIFIAVFISGLLIFDKSKRSFWFTYLLALSLPALFLLLSRFSKPVSGDYSDNYRLNFQLLLNTWHTYQEYFNSTWISSIFKLSLIFAVLNIKRWRGSLIAFWWTISSFILLLPWKLAFGRYLLPVLPGLFLFVTLQTQSVRQWGKRYKPLQFLLIPLAYFWLNYLYTNSIQFYNFLSSHQARETANSQLVTYLKDLPAKTSIYFNFPDDLNNLEWIDGTTRQLHYLYARTDLVPRLAGSSLPKEGILLTWNFVPSLFPSSPSANLATISYSAAKIQPVLKSVLKSGFFIAPETFTWQISLLK